MCLGSEKLFVLLLVPRRQGAYTRSIVKLDPSRPRLGVSNHGLAFLLQKVRLLSHSKEAWITRERLRRPCRDLNLKALTGVVICLCASASFAWSPTVAGLPQGGMGPTTVTVELTPLPTPTPTCSCSAACRCSSADQPYGVGAVRPNPEGGAELHRWKGLELEASSTSSSTDVEWEDPSLDDFDQSCPQGEAVPPTATPLPGGSWNLIALHAREAWGSLGWPSLPLTQRRVYVAVIDTGVDVSHPDLQQRIAPWQQSFAGLVPSTDVSADSAHGTAMASIIAAIGDNGTVGIDGIMWGAQIVPCKVGGGSNGTLGKALRCLEWLEDLIDREQVRIAAINFSFGSECCDCDVERAIARLRDRGVLVVASAGNGRKNSDAPGGCPFYPASYPLSNVVAVTGSDRYGNVLFRYGKRRVHVAAPGVQIPVLTPGGGRSLMPGGSSPAAAHATGVVALLYAQDPTRSWKQVRNLLLSSGPKVQCGSQPECALVSGRRVQAWGSGGLGALSCSNQVVVRRLLPVEDKIMRQPGKAVVLRVLSIECALPRVLPPVAVRQASPSGGVIQELVFRDDGVSPDEVADDCEFHAVWTVPAPPGRKYRLTVGEETLEIVVVPTSQT